MILLKLLKSIRFWTITGTLIALISLYFTYVDTASKKSLTYTVGEIVPDNIKNHTKIGVICLILTGYPPQEDNHLPVYMLPSPINIGNETGKTVVDIAENVTPLTSPQFIRNHPSMTYVNEDKTTKEIKQNQPCEILFEKIRPRTATSSVADYNGLYYYITVNEGNNDFDRIVKSHYTIVYDGMNEAIETDVTMIVEIIEKDFDKDLIPKLIEKYGKDFDEMYGVFYGPNDFVFSGKRINYYGLKIVSGKTKMYKLNK